MVFCEQQQSIILALLHIRQSIIYPCSAHNRQSTLEAHGHPKVKAQNFIKSPEVPDLLGPVVLYLKGPIAEVVAAVRQRSKFGFDFQPAEPGEQGPTSPSNSHRSLFYFLIRLLSQNSIFIHVDLVSKSPLKGPSNCQAIRSAGAAAHSSVNKQHRALNNGSLDCFMLFKGTKRDSSPAAFHEVCFSTPGWTVECYIFRWGGVGSKKVGCAGEWGGRGVGGLEGNGNLSVHSRENHFEPLPESFVSGKGSKWSILCLAEHWH